MITLDTKLESLKGIGQIIARRLRKLAIENVRDLLWNFPIRYEDFSNILNIAELDEGMKATVSGIIQKSVSYRSIKRKIPLVECEIADSTGKMRAIWFNQPYLRTLLRPGKRINISGKVIRDEKGFLMHHPVYEFSTSLSKRRHTGRLIPIYSETKKLTSKGIRFVVQEVLNKLSKIEEWMPYEVLKNENLPEINQALVNIHFPPNLREAMRAKRRFIFEELFLLQLYTLSQRLKLAQEKAPVIEANIEELKEILSTLPFELTHSQKVSLWEIIKDLKKSKPMNRLLQGDVGSGKTVVAILASLIAAKEDYQTAFMAPTEVLARQHFETIKNLIFKISKTRNRKLQKYIPPIALLSSSLSKIIYEGELESNIKKEKCIEKINQGEIKIIVGTHALIQKKVKFPKLALVIVDEQHRFGVKQRQSLLQKGSLVPHFLSMTATPIPRTLMLSIFGDLDTSLIKELPKGRKKIITRVIPPEKRERAYQFIREQVNEGRQVFVICPRIEKSSSEKQEKEISSVLFRKKMNWEEVKAVKEEYEKLANEIFPDLKIGLLYGKMKAKEKEEIMQKFKNKEIDILVSTSVIEVGIDVPNAAVMMIEGAERFGLAQLYQFRGRVGRGKYQSYCLLFTTSAVNQETLQRLKAITTAKSGFELAEMDLKIRGPGEFLGEQQSGFNDIILKALQDVSLVKAGREAAIYILKTHKTLDSLPKLKNKIKEFQIRVHLE